MIANTVFYIFYFILLTLSILGYGIFILSVCKVNWKKLSLGLSGLIGLFFVTFISYITHIFFPHNFFHNSIVHILGITFLIYFYKKNFFILKISKLFLFILLFISSLFISKNHEDFPYYHLPYMIQIVENKLQFGIGLFNIAFKTPSSLFYLQSTFYFPYVNFYLFHSASLIILIFGNIFFVDYFTNKKNIIFIRILASLSFVFINITFARIGGFGTDRGGQIVSFVIIILLLEFLNNKGASIDKLKVLVILIIYIITIKSYFFPYLLILPLLLISKFAVTIKILYDFKIIFLLGIFFLIYLFINFSNSGCLLYPIKYTCFDNFSWSVASSKAAEHYAKWYELWAKAGATPNYRVDDPEKYVQFLNWVPNWINNYFFGKGLDVTLIILSLFIIYLLTLKKKKISKTNNRFYLTYLFLILLFVIWFNKHPDFRYGGYVIYALLFFIPLSNYLSKSIKNDPGKILFIIAVLAVFIFNSKNLLRIRNEIIDQRELYSFKNFPYFNVKQPQYKVILLNDNSKANLVTSDMCWATPSPCLSSILNRKTINNYQIYYSDKILF